ncbi:hypothetical protein TSAR_006412 [Trichomalopsis sarcophagae]|uniref:Uncharacterized protein n=1 Tax=Trichomalopsis sarcophagae TaxID=543379 RepID=A0A232EG95_9HYME|nr:hypothetical protein TSAR_006412 [Trichomalopsis sarcophagae]
MLHIKKKSIFVKESVLTYLYTDVLRKLCKYTQQKEQEKSATKENLIKTLSGYKSKKIHATLRLDDIRKKAKI